MKSAISQACLRVMVGAISCLPLAAAFAAETNSPPAEPAAKPAAPAAVVPSVPAPPAPVAPAPVAPAVPAAPVAVPAPAKLPYGADDVVKLTQANVSEDIVMNYVLNSGTVYNLGAKDIIYLRGQGVSDAVINTMMNQRNHVAEEAAQQQAVVPPPAAAPAYADQGQAPQPQYAPSYINPMPAPEPDPSTLYVIPYTPSPSLYYYSRPYYSVPNFGVVYTFGRGGYYGFHGGYRGGFHGGGFHRFGGHRR